MLFRSPHSDIHGSMPAFGSPWLFADCCVLRRLLVPRHSPCALCSLTIITLWLSPLRAILLVLWVVSRRSSFCSPYDLSHGYPLITILPSLSLFSFQGAIPGSTPSYTLPYGLCVSRRFALAAFAAWWAQVDSNHRPHAYQACALTT